MYSHRFVSLSDASRLAAVAATGLVDGPAFGELERILDLATRCLGASCAAFLLLTDKEFLLRGSARLVPPLDNLDRWPLQWEFLLAAAFQGSLSVTDLGVSWLSAAKSGFPAGKLPAFLGAPVHDAHGNVLGVVALWDAREKAWTESDTALASEFAATVGSLLRNIDERKRAQETLKAGEERLRQSQKMEAMGRLAGGVAHDFNNLLTAINGFSDLLLISFPKDDARRTHIEEIRKAGARAFGLTSQLLSFSRKQVLAPRRLDLNEVIAGMETMLRRLIAENIEFRTRLDPGLAKVVADPNQMEQVILNLVLNARDAMPDGGELLVATSNGRLEADDRSPPELPPGDYVVIDVRDTGSGMDAETKAHLFEPFFTTKEPGKGTGLGLSTVYGAVKQANGSICVESEPDRGARFLIHLPASAGPERPVRRSRERKTRAPVGTETILLVEDENAVRSLVRNVLEAGGYRVLEADGGERALRVARSESGAIHLLLTDVVMGGISGRELAERLRPERPDLKMLFMSGYTEDAIIRHGVLKAHMAFIAKPFSPDAIAAKVREVLDGVREGIVS